jgi:hypothetical protein
MRLKECQEYMRFVLATQGIDEPRADRYRAHVSTLASRLGVRVLQEVVWGADNAYASRKQITIEPIRSEWLYATALHELGHSANPCQPTHVRVPAEDKKTVCVRCEFNAWRWAQQNALDWTREAHENQVKALTTYRKYATPDEARELDGMNSDIGYRRALMSRW